jgi:hypothetical protein
MTKFDSVINEAGILNTLQNVGAGVGSAIKSAENPANAIPIISDQLKKQKEAAQSPLGKDNPPKKGQYITMQENPNVLARVVDVQNNGMFSIQLLHVSDELEQQINSGKPVPNDMIERSSNQKRSDFLFVQTTNNPKWQLVTRERAKELANLTNQAQQQTQQQAQQQGTPVQQFTPIVIPENLNKFLVFFNEIIQEKKGSKRTRKPRQTKGKKKTTKVQPQTQDPEIDLDQQEPDFEQQEQPEPVQQDQQEQPEPVQQDQPEPEPVQQKQPEPVQQKQPQKERLLVLNGRGKFTETAMVGPGTSFPNWMPIPTTTKKSIPSQNQPEQEQQQQPLQQNQD